MRAAGRNSKTRWYNRPRRQRRHAPAPRRAALIALPSTMGPRSGTGATASRRRPVPAAPPAARRRRRDRARRPAPAAGAPRRASAARASAGSRVLDPYLIARRQQDADRELEALLGAGGDHDLARFAAHRAGRSEVIAKALAQPGQSARIGIAEIVGAKRPDGKMGQLAPSRDGSGIDQRAAGRERPFLRGGSRPLEIGKIPRWRP